MSQGPTVVDPLALALSPDSEAAERLTALLMSAEEAFWSYDLHERTISVSRTFEISFGHRTDEIGPDSRAWFHLIHPADVRQVIERARAALASDVPMWSGEFRLRLIDRSYTRVRCRAAIMRDPAGTPIRLVGSIADLTARASDMAELRHRTGELLELTHEVRAEKDRRALVERLLDEVVWEWDIASGSTRFSGAIETLFGCRADQIDHSYDSWMERVHHDDRTGVTKSVSGLIERHVDEAVVTYRFRRADGSYVWVRDRALSERGADGAPRRLVGSMRMVPEPDSRAVTPAPRLAHLPPRQAEVLELVRAGYGNKEIARRLGIGEQSVKEHVSRLFKRFDVPNRVALVAATNAVQITAQGGQATEEAPSPRARGGSADGPD